MPVQFKFKTAFICQEVIEEKNGVFSPVRLLEIVHVPEGSDNIPLHFYAVILLKTAPAIEADVRIGLTLVSPRGERIPMVVSANQPPHRLRIFDNDPSVPSGINLVIEFNVKPEILGTWLVEIDIDDEVAVTTPFTLRRAVESAR